MTVIEVDTYKLQQQKIIKLQMNATQDRSNNYTTGVTKQKQNSKVDNFSNT